MDDNVLVSLFPKDGNCPKIDSFTVPLSFDENQFTIFLNNNFNAVNKYNFYVTDYQFSGTISEFMVKYGMSVEKELEILYEIVKNPLKHEDYEFEGDISCASKHEDYILIGFYDGRVIKVDFTNGTLNKVVIAKSEFSIIEILCLDDQVIFLDSNSCIYSIVNKEQVLLIKSQERIYYIYAHQNGIYYSLDNNRLFDLNITSKKENEITNSLPLITNICKINEFIYIGSLIHGVLKFDKILNVFSTIIENKKPCTNIQLIDDVSFIVFTSDGQFFLFKDEKMVKNGYSPLRYVNCSSFSNGLLAIKNDFELKVLSLNTMSEKYSLNLNEKTIRCLIWYKKYILLVFFSNKLRIYTLE
ncbi:hypothetical protein EDEG_00931 [Edhazardia aedis USNM 41457]|uniref:Uncharacterized protein n=1 Tax=Edhazardia aedis (strain USNM 41457) TaxID=1003232 RepID=J8ZZ18_EDHAE|nr:hypothetical protein EDEG_00931 [Edhazardia aedis USNM 41457]|eukprot:EJW04938.1 hypothetical protein EDEG_00931 [Edhazardia aedis USNM 41457]